MRYEFIKSTNVHIFFSDVYNNIIHIIARKNCRVGVTIENLKKRIISMVSVWLFYRSFDLRFKSPCRDFLRSTRETISRRRRGQTVRVNITDTQTHLLREFLARESSSFRQCKSSSGNGVDRVRESDSDVVTLMSARSRCRRRVIVTISNGL